MVYRARTRVFVPLVCAIMLGATSAGTAQDPATSNPVATPPSLTRSVLRESPSRTLLAAKKPPGTRNQRLRLRLTLSAKRGDHAAIFVGLDRGATAYTVPGLGASVPLDLSRALMFTSTMDGRMKLDRNGRWSTDLEFPAEIRMTMCCVHFQAAVIRPVGGMMTLLVSDPLDVDLRPQPFNRLERLLESSSLPNARWAPARDPTPGFFVDPFGNRILHSRTWR